jgi:hypothetical protein
MLCTSCETVEKATLLLQSGTVKKRLEESGLQNAMLMRALARLHVYACNADGRSAVACLPYPLAEWACPGKGGTEVVVQYLIGNGMQHVLNRFQALTTSVSGSKLADIEDLANPQ